MKLRFEDVRAVPGMSNELYHSQPFQSLSSTRLKYFLPPTREREFFRRYIRGCSDPDETAALSFGQFAHHVVLESQSVTAESWHKNTVALFETRDPPARDPDHAKVDGFGKVSEELWIVSTPVPGLYRRCRQWGSVRSCQWRHEQDLVDADAEWLEELDDPCPLLSGFVAFQDMLVSGDGFLPVPPDLLGKNGSKARTVFKEWKKENRGARILDFRGNHGWGQAILARQEIRNHEAARRLLMDGRSDALVEYTLVGRDVDFGYEIRARMDRARISDGILHITDLKTSRDSEPSAWQKQCWKDSLPMQAYIMTQLGASCFGMPVEYKYVAVGKGVDSRVEVFEMDTEAVELGGEMFEEAVMRFQECERSNIWRPKTHGHVHRVTVPYYLQQDRKRKQSLHGTGAEGFYDD